MNTSISILHQHLKYVLQNATQKYHTLYIATDNAQKELKNKGFLWYASWLIKQEHFSNVQLFSLPVGHTHDLVDQRFKPWNEREYFDGFKTMEDIHLFVKKAFPNLNVRSFILFQTYDWISFFKGNPTPSGLDVVHSIKWLIPTNQQHPH